MLAPLLAQPHSKAANLFDQLNTLAGKFRPILDANDLNLARLRGEGLELFKSDPLHGAILLGSIAVLTKDENAMRQWFARAHQQSAGHEVVSYNYSIALGGLGFFTEALEEAQRAHRRSSGVLLVVDNLISAYSLAGYHRHAVSLLRQRNSQTKDGAYPGADALGRVAEFMVREDIPDEVVFAQQHLAAQVMHEAGVYSSNLHYRISDDEESVWLSGMWYLDEPIEKVVDLDWLLAERLVSLGQGLPDSVNFMFVVNKPNGHPAA
jgi:hypothetical protein